MKMILLLPTIFFAARLSAQSDTLGLIEIYGQRKVGVPAIREALGLREGEHLSPQTFHRQTIGKRLKAVKGISNADVTLLCCEDGTGRSMLFVGIDDQDLPPVKRNGVPNGAARLGTSILQTYARFQQEIVNAVKAGQGRESDEQGHVLMEYPPIRPFQDSLIAYAATHLPLLKQVLNKSARHTHRQAASWIIAYTADKRSIVPDLVIACNDQDETVRNNATRALGVLARYANAHPEAHIRIDATPFLKNLRSIVWTDRNKSAMVLEALTTGRDSSLLKRISQTLLPEITEMARWRNAGHAMFSFVILGRIAGIADDGIFQAFISGNRLMVIDEWLKMIRRY